MTQELVVWVLVAGLIGLIWVFTCSILTEDRRHQESDDQTAEHSSDAQSFRKAAERRVAA